MPSPLLHLDAHSNYRAGHQVHRLPLPRIEVVHVEAHRDRHQMRDVPILISPVSSAPAFHHGRGNYRPGDPFNYRDTMRFCQWLNLAGFPGLSMPLGRSPEGLPINVQLIARPFEEHLLLDVAASLERARGPWHAPPNL